MRPEDSQVLHLCKDLGFSPNWLKPNLRLWQRLKLLGMTFDTVRWSVFPGPPSHTAPAVSLVSFAPVGLGQSNGVSVIPEPDDVLRAAGASEQSLQT